MAVARTPLPPATAQYNPRDEQYVRTILEKLLLLLGTPGISQLIPFIIGVDPAPTSTAVLRVGGDIYAGGSMRVTDAGGYILNATRVLFDDGYLRLVHGVLGTDPAITLGHSGVDAAIYVDSTDLYLRNITGAITKARLDGVGAFLLGTDPGALGASDLLRVSGGAIFASTDPRLSQKRTDAGADSKIWDQFISTTTLQGRIINDAASASTAWLTVTRSGITVSSIAFGGNVKLPSIGKLFFGVAATDYAVRAGAGSPVALEVVAGDESVYMPFRASTLYATARIITAGGHDLTGTETPGSSRYGFYRDVSSSDLAYQVNGVGMMRFAANALAPIAGMDLGASANRFNNVYTSFASVKSGTGGEVQFTSDGSGQTHGIFGVSGSIDGQGGQFQIKGTSTIPIAFYTNATQRATWDSAGLFKLTSQVVLAQFDNGDKAANFTIDWNNGNHQRVRLTAAGPLVITFSNPSAGGAYVLEIVQDGTGSRTVTWPAAAIWAGGTTPTLTTTINKADYFTFYYDAVPGTPKYLGSVGGLNFTV